MRSYYLILVFLLMAGCKASDKEESTNQAGESSWAIRFADAVMNDSDSLIYYHRDSPKFEYDFALLASAMDRVGTEDQKYADYARAYIDYFVREDGGINGYKLSDYNIDRVRPGLNILQLYKKTGEEKYRIAAETLAGQMKEHPRTNSGGYWHKKRYPYQMWLDGIYMGHPFLTEFGDTFDKPEWFDEVSFQVRHIYEHTLDPETGLLYHAWDESKMQEWCNPETGQSLHFWGRAMGWYLMAIVDILDYFPEDHPERDRLIEILNHTSEALLKVQDPESGLWYQVLDMGGEEGNYLEGSCSSMFTYAFAKGARKGFLPEKFQAVAERAFDGIIETLVVEDQDGFPVLTQVCASAGLGGDPYRMGDYDYYINERKEDNDRKGVGPLIMAAVELGK
jgi:unsaturated rhamnogalacturonyl hydrolase